MKIRPLGAEFHTERRTTAFRNFMNSTKRLTHNLLSTVQCHTAEVAVLFCVSLTPREWLFGAETCRSLLTLMYVLCLIVCIFWKI